MSVFNKNNKTSLFRITFMTSVIFISYYSSDFIAYSLSTSLVKPAYGGLLAVFINFFLFFFKIFSYQFFKIVFTIIFSLIGGFLLLHLEKSRFYRSLLEKTEQYTASTGWLIWMGLSVLPFLFVGATFLYYEASKTNYKDPNENTKVELNGHIDKTMSYTIKATYRAKNKVKGCSDGIFDEYFKSKVHTYHPRITGTLHSLNIPLDAEKKSVCHYQIISINMCLTKISNNKKNQEITCNQLLTLDNDNSNYMADGHLYQEAKDNKLTIYCRSQENLNLRCTQDRDKRKSITQYIKTGNQNYIVNIYDQGK